MAKPKCFFRAFTESGRLIALAIAIAMLVGIVGPAAAQFFNFSDFGRQEQQPQRGGGRFGNDLFAPYQQQVQQRQVPRRIMEDFSKAPPPEKRETVPE
jgi:uncharacterized protein